MIAKLLLAESMYAHRDSQEQSGPYLPQLNVAVRMWEIFLKTFVLSVAIVIILLRIVVNANVTTVIFIQQDYSNQRTSSNRKPRVHLLRLRQSCCCRLSNAHSGGKRKIIWRVYCCECRY